MRAALIPFGLLIRGIWEGAEGHRAVGMVIKCAPKGSIASCRDDITHFRVGRGDVTNRVANYSAAIRINGMEKDTGRLGSCWEAM